MTRSTSESTELDRRAASVLAWIHEAGNPYFDWLFGDAATARSTLSGWLQRSESEVALSRVRGVPADEPVGGYIALTSAELRAARQADALALVAEARGTDRRALLSKLRATAGLFTEPDEDELYLSKMGVHADVRGRGHGRRVLDAFVAEASSRGFPRLRLDVSADNHVAMNLYRSAGFTALLHEQRTRAGLTYVPMSRDAT